MLTLEKESFYYKNWCFEFYRSPIDEYKLFVVGKNEDKALRIELPYKAPTLKDKAYILEYIEKEEKKVIEHFKSFVLKGELELL